MAACFLAGCDTVSSLEPEQGRVFMKLYGGTKDDIARDFLQLDDGGFIIVGSTWSFDNEQENILLIRTDANGNEVWIKNLASNVAQSAYSIIRDNSGTGFVICGETADDGDARDIFLAKIGETGNIIESANFGLPGREENGRKVIPAHSEGYLVMGNNVDSTSIYFVEVNESLEAKPGRERTNEGPQGFVNTGAAVEIFDGSRYIGLGTTTDGVGSNQGSENLFLFTLDLGGVGVVPVRFIGAGDRGEVASDMKKVADGYIIAGYKINNNIQTPYLVKVRQSLGEISGANGIVWEQTYEGLLGGSNRPVSVIETNDGGYAVLMTSNVLQFGSQLALMKVDSEGNQLWERHFGSQNSDVASKVIQIEGGYFVACGSFSLRESSNIGLQKAGLVKTNPAGELIPLGN